MKDSAAHGKVAVVDAAKAKGTGSQVEEVGNPGSHTNRTEAKEEHSQEGGVSPRRKQFGTLSGPTVGCQRAVASGEAGCPSTPRLMGHYAADPRHKRRTIGAH